MNSRFRVFFFKYYWALAALGSLGSVLLAYYSKIDRGACLSSVGGVWGLFYFIQKQKLEETRLFSELFNQFNSRYHELHPTLHRIRSEELSTETAHETLDRYFNLCAEEYLFFREGRIHRDVWRAWCRGMLAFLSSPVFFTYWDREVKTDSHYGLTLEEIESGAEAKLPSRTGNQNSGSQELNLALRKKRAVSSRKDRG